MTPGRSREERPSPEPTTATAVVGSAEGGADVTHETILESHYKLATAPEEGGFFLRAAICETCGAAGAFGVRICRTGGEAFGTVQCACGLTRYVRSMSGTWQKRRSGMARETPRRPQWSNAR